MKIEDFAKLFASIHSDWDLKNLSVDDQKSLVADFTKRFLALEEAVKKPTDKA